MGCGWLNKSSTILFLIISISGNGSADWLFQDEEEIGQIGSHFIQGEPFNPKWHPYLPMSSANRDFRIRRFIKRPGQHRPQPRPQPQVSNLKGMVRNHPPNGKNFNEKKMNEEFHPRQQLIQREHDMHRPPLANLEQTQLSDLRGAAYSMGWRKQFFAIIFVIFCISSSCWADWLTYDEGEEIPLERQRELGIIQVPSRNSNPTPPPNKYFADERFNPAPPPPPSQNSISMATIQKSAEVQLKRRQQEMKEKEEYEQKLQQQAQAKKLAAQGALEIAKKSQEVERERRLREEEMLEQQRQREADARTAARKLAAQEALEITRKSQEVERQKRLREEEVLEEQRQREEEATKLKLQATLGRLQQTRQSPSDEGEVIPPERLRQLGMLPDQAPLALSPVQYGSINSRPSDSRSNPVQSAVGHAGQGHIASSKDTSGPSPNKYFADDRIYKQDSPAPSPPSQPAAGQGQGHGASSRDSYSNSQSQSLYGQQRGSASNSQYQYNSQQQVPQARIATPSPKYAVVSSFDTGPAEPEAPAHGKYFADERIYKPDSASSLADSADFLRPQTNEEWMVHQRGIKENEEYNRERLSEVQAKEQRTVLSKLEKERQEEHRRVQELMKSVKEIQAENEQLRLQERYPSEGTYNHKTHSHGHSNNRHHEHRPGASALVGSDDQSEPNREVSFVDKYFRLRNDCDNDYQKMNMIFVPLCILLGIFYVYC